MTHSSLTPSPSALLRTAREHLLVGCAAVIGLHIADDAFLHPQPGVSAADHLPGGLVQLALLTAAVALATRAKPGLRASIAAAIGLFGLVGSSEALHQLGEGAGNGDDLTGLLMIPAGLLLLGHAGSLLWRSRRLDDRRPWRYGRRVLRGAGTLLALALVAFPIGLGYVSTHLMRTETPKDELGVAHEDVTFETSDGLTLHGWYVPSRNGANVIVFPGRAGSQRQTRVLAKHGYGVLLFDRRGEGASEGDSNMFGWDGERDVVAAVDYLESRPGVDPDRIAGVGLSVGGELLLELAAETDVLDAVVSDGAGGRMWQEELEEATSGVERALFAPSLLLKTAAIATFSSTSPPEPLHELIPKITEPTMLIWTGALNDTRGWDYLEALRAPNEHLYLPDAGHVGGVTHSPELYERRLVGFLDRALAR